MIWYLFYIGIYVLFMFGMGFYYLFKVKTYSDYLIGGWNMGFWSITGTSISTWTGAAVFVGWLGMGFTVGISGYFKFALPGVIFSILLVYLFAVPLRRQKLYTLADLFSERFGGKSGILPSIISAVIIAIPGTALQLIAMSTVFNIFFDMGYGLSVFLSFIFIVGFTILGGLPATIITDAIQSVVLFIGVVILFVVSLTYAGGFKEIIANTPTEFVSPTGPFGLTEVLVFALSVGPFYIISQTSWQRIFAAKSESVAKKAGITGFTLAGLIAILPFSIGIIARQFVPSDVNPDFIFSYVTSEVLHPAIGGIVIIGLIAALVTSADSFILSGASNLTQDLYSRIINPNASDKKLLHISRITVVIISVLGLLIAFNLPSIVDLWQSAIRLAAATLLFPFLAVMFWKRVTKKGMIWSVITTTIASLIWPLLGINIDVVFIGLSVSLVSLISFSIATEHEKEEQVRAVYWQDLNSADRHS